MTPGAERDHDAAAPDLSDLGDFLAEKGLLKNPNALRAALSGARFELLHDTDTEPQAAEGAEASPPASFDVPPADADSAPPAISFDVPPSPELHVARPAISFEAPPPPELRVEPPQALPETPERVEERRPPVPLASSFDAWLARDRFAAHDEAAQRGPSTGWRRLGELLVEAGVVSQKTLQQALKRQRRDRRPLGDLLLDAGVREADVVSAVGTQIGRSAIDVDAIVPDAEAIATIDAANARRLGALPLGIDRTGRLHVATPRPGDEELGSALQALTGRQPILHLAGRNAVGRAIDRHYPVFDRVGTAVEQAISDRVETAERQAVNLQVDAPVVQIVDLLLTQGLRDRASDIHLEPQEDRLRVRYRIDGALHDVQDLPRALTGPIASRLKILADMDIVDRHRPQDGQIALRLDDRAIDIRVATMETVWGEKVVLRLLDPERSLVSLASLGLGPDAEAILRRLVASPYGLVVVSGPTGAGKTTTLYSLLNELDRGQLNITTIEDPVEYQFENINQIRINRLAGMTFANGLKAILRQDPDVILVGEVRDAETATIAIQAALTGHLVLCSLHASDTAGAIHRFLDMGIESFLVASALIGVVAQRLVRKNCEHCGEAYMPSPDELEFYHAVRGRDPKHPPRHGVGCTVCGGRKFLGRTGVFESLQIDDDLRQLVVDKTTHVALRKAAVGKGMKTLQQSSIELVDDGVTTLAEAMRAVYVI